MPLDSSLLYHFVRDALRPYSEDFRITDRHNPTQFTLNHHPYSAHVSYVHDSGNARDNDDEVRIQIGRPIIENQRDRAGGGARVAFLGFFEGGKTFVGWDPRHVFSLQARTVVSVYARQSQTASVEEHQAAVHRFRARILQEQSFAIALPSSALGFYLENIERFHRLPTEAAIVQLINTQTSTLADAGLGTGGEIDLHEGDQREKFTYERKAYPRDPRFAKWVLDAYRQTCCVCDRQLGIVQAAHIIPHSEGDSPNSVQNGLAMCIEHHRLYDDALLLPGPERTLVLNHDRAQYLRQTNQMKGLQEIEELEGKQYNVPDGPKQQPRAEYLARGLASRMVG